MARPSSFRENRGEGSIKIEKIMRWMNSQKEGMGQAIENLSIHMEK